MHDNEWTHMHFSVVWVACIANDAWIVVPVHALEIYFGHGLVR